MLGEFCRIVPHPTPMAAALAFAAVAGLFQPAKHSPSSLPSQQRPMVHRQRICFTAPDANPQLQGEYHLSRSQLFSMGAHATVRAWLGRSAPSRKSQHLHDFSGCMDLQSGKMARAAPEHY